MAPVSQLLVYYITAEGEPISDVISFDVKLLHKQVIGEAMLPSVLAFLNCLQTV